LAADVDEQAVKVTIKATEITAQVLKDVISRLLNRNYSDQGEQKLSKLNEQDKKLESIDISSEDLRGIRKELNRHAVDFSVMKDKTAGKYTVYFKAKDVDRVYAGLQKYMKGIPLTSKKPIKEVFEQAQTEAKKRETKPLAKEHSADRGYDER